MDSRRCFDKVDEVLHGTGGRHIEVLRSQSASTFSAAVAERPDLKGVLIRQPVPFQYVGQERAAIDGRPVQIDQLIPLNAEVSDFGIAPPVGIGRSRLDGIDKVEIVLVARQVSDRS